MDPYAPINGISLERYAELGAELDGITDPDEQKRKVGSLGVSAADWDAAVQGFTARMQDMSLMGQVATRYMQLYNQALAAKKGVASLSLEDWCAVSAAIQVFGYEGAMAHYKLSQGDWTTISAHWTTELTKDPMNLAMRRNQMQEQEAARLRSGGAPKPIQVNRTAGGAAPAGGGAAYDPNAAAASMMQAAQANQQQWMGYSAGVMNQPGVQAAMQVAGAMNVMGGGSGLIAGRQVLVQWSDGNRYPATIMQVASGQAQVVFPDGRNMWVENRYLTPA
ncbi:MAG: hypothetical protein HUU21_29110 [Polyangiaceae bacterium]|nr:hypothetical protein [Polyangiaceae bacterium]NUQ77617.1 hypothetical protein [Polyangiaceae bacterium]